MPREKRPPSSETWRFFIDRGGTFTDVVGIRKDGLQRVHKLLSVNPRHYQDAAVQGIRDILGTEGNRALRHEQIDQVRLGTTVATNALLERKGEPTVLVVNNGFKDALRIAYQNRPDIFARRIILPSPLYSTVIEVDGRFSRDGNELEPFDPEGARTRLQAALDLGMSSCAIVFMHSYLFPQHEELCARVASEVGFKHITVSHSTSPLIKLVARGDTTVADAYLSPILQRYLDRFCEPLKSVSVYFMQSNGGLADRNHFRGKDSLLSGPAGGVVGAVETGKALGFERIVSFDMGGTSTDVSHFDGQFERQDLTTIGGVRIRAPMIAVHTIAAGGGSVLRYDGHRFLVGPESAGSNPGPACYRNGGPLTITDANLLLGRIQADYFPSVFGEDGKQPLDLDVVADRFLDFKAQLNRDTRTEDIAWGFIEIAVEKMARAIKKITIERGYDVEDAVLNSFGGAGGQHACLIAESLGMDAVMIHKMAGVLSAMGIGLSSIKVVEHQAVQKRLDDVSFGTLEQSFSALSKKTDSAMNEQKASSETRQRNHEVLIRYAGSDTTLAVPFKDRKSMARHFHELHLQRFGFHAIDSELIVESITLEATALPDRASARPVENKVSGSGMPEDLVKFYSKGRWWLDTPIIRRENLDQSQKITGPAIVIDDTSTNIIEPGWTAELSTDQTLLLRRVNVSQVSQKRILEAPFSTRQAYRVQPSEKRGAVSQNKEVRTITIDTTTADPILLELFNNKFMAIAEEMGVTLCHTSQSVNIKERLDFSCALFDAEGKLIANAPHMPVHLGSMGESVRAVIDTFQKQMNKGDVYVLNNPYRGGTHLPDITVVTPVFSEEATKPVFYTASRGHHADIGGITAGSMPPNSKTIEEEGALIDPTLLVSRGVFQEAKMTELLSKGPYPSRNVDQNISDLKAQIAANNRGVLSLDSLIESYGLEAVYAYMHFVRKNAEDCVREAIEKLSDAHYEVEMDSGAKIRVTITVDRASRSATVDFTGSSGQQAGNLNAPRAITIAAVLYVFRTLVDENIPLNDGCLAPLNIIVPEDSMLNPANPAAVVAGNVETSQAIVDAVYGALNVMAASQGTMNNFTFGNSRYQYYETVCGGSGAGPDHDGCDAVQTHMTNSRLTDPEVLEWRFPVILKEFSIRQGSGGRGKYNGGNGVIRRLQFAEPMEASILSERRRIVPFGMNGGNPGLAGHNYVVRQKDGSVVELSGTQTVEMEDGDIFVIETPGGGGWGAPP